MILKAAGHNVTVVSDGTECVQLCIEEGRPFDLIVMDISMPKMPGDEATRQLRANAETKNVPILCCSAKAGKEDIAVGMTAGCTHYITKPFRNRQLLAAVDETLTRAVQRTS